MADSARKLAAIVFTDIVGFIKLSSENEPAALALLETQRNILIPVVDQYNGEWLKEIGDGLLLSLCLKELKRQYDISDLDRLIEKEKNDIGEIENYYIFKLLGEGSYLKDAYEKVMKTKSNLEPEVAEKYINYPYVKEIIREWERNI